MTRFMGMAAAGWLLTVAAATGAATPKVGEKAEDFTLGAVDGTKVQLSKLTEAGPVVLVVLRGYPGYQCPLCTRQVRDLIGRGKEFGEAKAKVVLVYPGPASGLADRASEFLDGKGLPEPFTLVTDPDYTFTNAYGLRWDAKNETAYPSTFIIDGSGRVRFAKVSRQHGDRVGSKAILEALAAAR